MKNISGMVEMVLRLKGIILNCTLKSYRITTIESANVLEITMKFYWGSKYKSPSKRRRDRLRKEKFLAKFRRDPLLVPTPFLEPDQSPSPVAHAGREDGEGDEGSPSSVGLPSTGS